MANALAIAGRKDKNIIEDPSNLNKTVDVPGPGVVNATVVDPKIYKTATDEMDTDDTDTDLDDDETDTDLDTDETDI
jgi:hypothetical protein